uniref:ZP domain-containing protein n=1 Tax=Panagrellus redivivus TaxID=6233 RepID=A0A7E4W6C2_PANRE
MTPSLILICLLSICASLASGKSIDNKLIGTPSVKCGPDTIEIKGTTEKEFEGVLFIKNWRRKAGCATGYQRYVNTTTNPTYSIPLTDLSECGLELRRHPKTRELEVFTVFVFSFHSNFVTMSDRAFAVHCIFQQQSITVGTKFNFISDITTRATFNGVSRMPEPTLAIVNGRVPDENIAPATWVRVGDPIMFIWNTTHQSELYGIEVEDCLAKTLDGRMIKIIENGCTTDDLIISSVQYGDRNQKAFADAMAFKFPDADDIWIKCSVRTCIQRHKHLLIAEGISEDHICKSEPLCHNRRKRSAAELTASAKLDGTDENVHIIDQKMRVIDVYSPSEANLTLPEPMELAPLRPEEESKLCMLKSIYASSAAFMITLYVSTAISGGVLIYSLKRHASKTAQLRAQRC